MQQRGSGRGKRLNGIPPASLDVFWEYMLALRLQSGRLRIATATLVVARTPMNFLKLLGGEDDDDRKTDDPRAPRKGSDDPHAPRAGEDDPHAPRQGISDPHMPRDARGNPLVQTSGVGIRYIVHDVPAAIEFYTRHLGFVLQTDASPAFAAVWRDGVRLLLSGEGSSGKRALADGQRQEPGGWNRVHLATSDLVGDVKRLRAAGVKFRTTEVVSGSGGAQVIIEDPSGNAVELFQPLS